MLIEAVWEFNHRFNWKATKGDHPLHVAPMVPDPDKEPGPWFKDWAEHNPRHWWALCRFKPDSERLRLQTRILDCGSIDQRDMMKLWDYANRLELANVQKQKMRD